jgi:uncharacterized phage protein gp47/JayE
MASLNLKSFTEFVRSIFGKFTTDLPQVDPTIKPSLENTAVMSSAISARGLEDGIQDAINQAFWQTANDDFLELIGSYDNTIRLAATQASGYVSVNGTLSTLISSGTQLTYNANAYSTTQDSTVSSYTDTIALSYDGVNVTAITNSIHSLSSGLSITILGASQSNYNGLQIITVIDENTFTYPLTSGALSDDSGSYSAVYALVNIQSVNTGLNQNIDAAGTLNISVTNINPNAYVGNVGITGGYDIEDIEIYRQRVGLAHSLTPGIATEPSLIWSCRKIQGNTRVIIFRPVFEQIGGTRGTTGYLPQGGETVIYIIRDNDVDIIPSGTVLTNTYNQIISDGLWPTTNSLSSLMILAPNPVNLNITISNLLPNTATMRTSIQNQLVFFLRDNFRMLKADDTTSGILKIDDLKTFIRNVKDDTTGELITDFTLTSPTIDTNTNYGDILVSGTVTFL